MVWKPLAWNKCLFQRANTGASCTGPHSGPRHGHICCAIRKEASYPPAAFWHSSLLTCNPCGLSVAYPMPVGLFCALSLQTFCITQWSCPHGFRRTSYFFSSSLSLLMFEAWAAIASFHIVPIVLLPHGAHSRHFTSVYKREFGIKRKPALCRLLCHSLHARVASDWMGDGWS